MARKKVEDVRGYAISCINFESCPLCYGCRNFSSQDSECWTCNNENKKINICKTDIHKPHLVDKMISRNQINLDLLGGFDTDEPCPCIERD